MSTRARYGVRALCTLARLSREHPVPLSVIADCERLSRHYLGVIFHDLRKAGFVETERGSAGGYRLARHPEEISVADLVTLLDGPIAPVGCVLAPGEERDSRCPRKETCPSRPAWVRLQHEIERALGGITIASLLGTGETKAVVVRDER
jgi:Rrf2 family protein